MVLISRDFKNRFSRLSGLQAQPVDLATFFPRPVDAAQAEIKALKAALGEAEEKLNQSQTAGAKFYQTTPLLAHMSFGVYSYTRSRRFYVAVLAPFDVVPIEDEPILTTTGFGYNDEDVIFSIYEYSKMARAPGKGTHFCFNAPSRKAVREFWEAGIKLGGKSEGSPGIREELGPFHYAAYLTDPDGYKIEAVYSGMDGEP